MHVGPVVVIALRKDPEILRALKMTGWVQRDSQKEYTVAGTLGESASCVQSKESASCVHRGVAHAPPASDSPASSPIFSSASTTIRLSQKQQ